MEGGRATVCAVVLRGSALRGQPFCGRCGAITAFDVYGCVECSNRNFGFEDARDLLRYEGVGAELVHTLKYGGYLRILKRVMTPLVAGVLSGSPDSNRFDGVVPVPLHRSPLAKRGFNQAELVARGGCAEDKRARFR